MGKKFNVILNLCIFVIGVLFIVMWKHDNGVFNIASIATGVLLILFSSWTLVASFTKKRQSDTDSTDTFPLPLTIVPAVGSLVLGIVLIVANSFFAELFSYLFAALLIVAAVYKYWEFFTIRKTLKAPAWTIIVPSIIMVCGIVLLAIGIQEIQKILALIIGIAFIVFSVHSLLEHFVYRKISKAQRNNPQVINVNFEEIKEESVSEPKVAETPDSSINTEK